MGSFEGRINCFINLSHPIKLGRVRIYGNAVHSLDDLPSQNHGLTDRENPIKYIPIPQLKKGSINSREINKIKIFDWQKPFKPIKSLQYY